MASYYDLLKLKPNATAADIQVAYDALYNQRRQLVTHHDPKVVAQANQDLQALETIRAILMDPAKRASYDTGLGGVGGLADPEAILRPSAIPNTPPTPQPQPAPVTQRVDAWICPKCKHPNAVGMQFCARCGSQIGQACPHCGKSIAIADPFCAHCGAEIEAARRQQIEQRLRDLRAQLQQERQDIEPLKQISEKKWLAGVSGLGNKLYVWPVFLQD